MIFVEEERDSFVKTLTHYLTLYIIPTKRSFTIDSRVHDENHCNKLSEKKIVKLSTSLLEHLKHSAKFRKSFQ